MSNTASLGNIQTILAVHYNFDDTCHECISVANCVTEFCGHRVVGMVLCKNPTAALPKLDRQPDVLNTNHISDSCFRVRGFGRLCLVIAPLAPDYLYILSYNIGLVSYYINSYV